MSTRYPSKLGRVDASTRFGEALRRAREQAGLTQEELWKASDVHWVEISRMESGKRDVKLSTLIRLADALDVSLDELVGRER